MNALVRHPVAVLEGVRGVCLRGLHGGLRYRVVLRQRSVPTWPERLGVSRNLSTSPLVCGDVSRVPGSGASDSWTEAVGTGTPDVVQAVADAAQHGQDLASLGLGAWYTPVGLVQLMMDSLQASTGLPWWGVIGIATVVMRVLLFPLSVKFAANAAKMAKIQPELAEIVKNIQYYAKIGAKEQQEKEQIKMAAVYKNNDCSPFTMMTLPFMQLPVFMSFFIALRKMAVGPLESMKTGGMGWFTDLTVTDPTYALPLIACGIFITNIQVRHTTCSAYVAVLNLCVLVPTSLVGRWARRM